MKILVVRFSSIGDVVLTSPVVSAIREQLPDVEIHFLTKKSFETLVNANPKIDRVITIEKSIDEALHALKEENYDHIIDLHHNVRTKSLKMKLGIPMSSFPKLNWKKWLLVKLKLNKMPKLHVVDRYFEAAKAIGVQNTQKGIEFYINEENSIDTKAQFELLPKSYVSIALGAQFATKKMPMNKLMPIISEIKLPIILLGGEMDTEMAKAIIEKSKRSDILYATGKYNLQQSASILQQSTKLLTNDTGLMHIASAFDVAIVSVWGNTVPELGMYPYMPHNADSFTIHEVKGLSCRPCSKIGFQECPKGHFKCMQEQNVEEIISDLNA